MPSTPEGPQMPHNIGTSDTAVKDHDQDVLRSPDNNSSCVSKDDGAIVMSSDYPHDAHHKNTKSSAALVSSLCPDSLEICINGQSAGSGPFNEQLSVEGSTGQAMLLETVDSSDRVDPPETSAFRDELSGGTLSKGAPSECCVDQVESSSGQMPDLHNIDDKLNEQSGVVVKLETESNDDTLNCSTPITSAKEPPLQGHTVPDNNASDDLVDVRVCDICGDVGREALLALCSKCSDGAEHIYCMRIKMEKVPEHDWVCEDCILMQEPKRLKLTEVERSDTHNPSYLKDITQGLPTIHSGVWHADESKTNHSSKRSCLSAKRPVPDIELKSAPKRRALERGIQPPTSSHFGRKALLTRVSSLNITGKSKHGGPQVSSSGNQSVLEAMESTSPISGHKSPKPGSHTEMRPASKNIDLGKSSQPLKSPASGGKSMLTRVSSSKIMNKDKDACYRTSSLGTQSGKQGLEQENFPSGERSPNLDLQFQPLNSSSVPKGKSQLTQVSSSKITDGGEGACFQASSFGIQSAIKDVAQESAPSGPRSPKPEPQFQALKSSLISGKISQLARVSSLKIINKGKDAPCQESSFGIGDAKKEVEQASALPGQRSPKRKPECHAGFLAKSKPINKADSNVEVRQINEDICSRRIVKGSANHEMKKIHAKKLFKSRSFSGSSSVSAAVSNDCLIHVSNTENQRHGSQMNSTEKNSTQLVLTADDFDAMKSNPSKTKMLSEIISRPLSSCDDVKNMMGMQVNRNSGLKPLGSFAWDGQSYENRLAGKSAQQADLGCPLREDDSQVVASNKVLPVDLHAMESSPDLNSADIVPPEFSAVPESACIWKGAFQMEEGGRLPNYYSGIQAHLSTCASSKVHELVPKFHPELVLKEVPRLDTWPVQFQKNCPTEQDIALYFFAVDLPSHARSYMGLLEGMIRDDLALEANFDGVQLLVFPSTLLPVRSQRWNDLFFLWGVFRVRNVDNHTLHISRMNVATLNQSSCTPVTDRALNRTLCASEAGSLSASHASDNCIKGLDSVNPKALQSSSSTKPMDQTCEHEEVSSADKCLGTQRAEDLLSCKDNCTTFGDDCIKKESFPDSMPHYDLKKEDGPVGYCNPVTRIFPFGWPEKDSMVSVSKFLQEEKRLDVASRSSFSIDSGPSGSSDGAGCAKSDEGQVDQFQDPSNCNTLNLDLCLRPMSEPEGGHIDLDLVLGSPNTNKYKAKHWANERSSKHGNVSLFLSLGMPCSNG